VQGARLPQGLARDEDSWTSSMRQRRFSGPADGYYGVCPAARRELVVWIPGYRVRGCVAGGPPPQLTKSAAPEGSPETLMVPAPLTPSITLLTELPVMVSAPNPPVAPSMIGALPAFHELR
jgi:hypothetical protein